MNLFCKAQREALYKKMLQTKVNDSSLKASRKTSSHFHMLSTSRTFFYIGKLTLDLIIIGLLETFQKFRKFSDGDPVHFKCNNTWLITIRLHLINNSFSKRNQSNRSWSYHFTFYICHTAWLWEFHPKVVESTKPHNVKHFAGTIKNKQTRVSSEVKFESW